MDDSETLAWHRWCVWVGKAKACGAKKGYKDETAAKRMAMMSNRRWHRGDMVGYPCAWCGRWHATRVLGPETRAELVALSVTLDGQLRVMEHTAARYAWTLGT